MRLEEVVLSGFKSFVDVTKIRFKGGLTGIVGPNGCGKSNVIDAVKWVMGESSAKQLRGISLTDVIFNGSVERKPVGQASIELIFDNSDGFVGGEYAKYNQLSIRRVIDREGQSIYSLNNIKCRRKDIADVFMGTGLGSHSYAIIEQGMISKLIESKPDELRAFVEEAAGISKYKDRRRETENRMRHTKENLSRINDLLSELQTQLERLKRQSRAAERYQVLKEEEKNAKAELLVVKWMDLDHALASNKADLDHCQTSLEACQSELQKSDTEIEKKRILQADVIEAYNEVQKRYYSLGSEISKVEQAIAFQKDRISQIDAEIIKAEQAIEATQFSLSEDESSLASFEAAKITAESSLIEVDHLLESSNESVAAAEAEIEAWLENWDVFNQSLHDQAQRMKLAEASLVQLDKQLEENEARVKQIEAERASLDPVRYEQELLVLKTSIDEEKSLTEESAIALKALIDNMRSERDKSLNIERDIAKFRTDLSDKRERFVSLKLLQQSALHEDAGEIKNWLSRENLTNRPRLAHGISVEDGWEKAVETVLGDYLEAICVEGFDSITSAFSRLGEVGITLLDIADESMIHHESNASHLSSKIKSDWNVAKLLEGVLVAESLSEALTRRPTLLPHESMITKSGIWIGKHWVRVPRDADSGAGVLLREKELKRLEPEIESLKATIAAHEQMLTDSRETLMSLEVKRESLQQALTVQQATVADNMAKQSVLLSEIEHIKHRINDCEDALVTLNNYVEKLVIERNEMAASCEEMKPLIEAKSVEREQLLEGKTVLYDKLNEEKKNNNGYKELSHKLHLDLQSNETQSVALKTAIARLSERIRSIQGEKEALASSRIDFEKPMAELNESLNALLNKRVDIDKEMAEVKSTVDGVENDLQSLVSTRKQSEGRVETMRGELESFRFAKQEALSRQDLIKEQLQELSCEINAVIDQLGDDVTQERCQENIEKIENRISRLGPINLAAIQEFEEVNERKNYLDQQKTDLDEAMDALTGAIKKIDKETKTKFKETFDRLNENFSELFPRIFEGGNARLELTDDDLLEAGVILMAKPPGKQIRSISLMSGGEKSLTAIAFIFSLFKLNPAPFCMLDEVDAALDDMNVQRFCGLIKEIAKSVQLIFISHNKAAIEMAEQLTGVTMSEPGVSRIVAVDIDQALALSEE